MNMFTKGLLGTAAVAAMAGVLAAPAAAQTAPSAAAKVVASGSEKVKLTVSGQISREMTLIDDGSETEVKHMDNDYAPSMFRIGGEGKVNSETSIGTMIELMVTPNNSSGTSQDAANTNSGGASTHEARIVEIFFANQKYGTVYMGKGSTGSDGSSELNLSVLGVTMAPMANSLAFGGALFKAGNDADRRGLNAVTVAGVLNEFVGMGRLNRVRYDSPTYFGTQFRATHADQGDWDVSLWHQSAIAGFDVAGAIAYSQAPNGQDYFGMVDGSVSVMSPWGIGVHGGFGYRNLTAANAAPGADPAAPFGWSAGVTYETMLIEAGKTGIGYMYQSVSNNAVNGFAGADATSHQVAVVQQIDAASTDLYAAWTQFSLDTTEYFGAGGAYVAGSGSGIQGVGFDDINVFSLGARVKF